MTMHSCQTCVALFLACVFRAGLDLGAASLDARSSDFMLQARDDDGNLGKHT